MPKLTWQERQAKEDAERAIVLAKVPEVAAQLGATYQIDEYRMVRIIGPDWQIRMYHNTHDNRLHISGAFPHDLWKHHRNSGPGADPACTFTVSPARPAGAIARDITARILPVYRHIYGLLTSRQQAHDRLQTAKNDQAQRIAAAGRGKIAQDRHLGANDTYATVTTYFGATVTSGQPWGKAEISGYTIDMSGRDPTGIASPKTITVNMELHQIPPELAEYIASLLGEWAEDE